MWTVSRDDKEDRFVISNEHGPIGHYKGWSSDGVTTPEEEEGYARWIEAGLQAVDALATLFKECAMVHRHWGENDNRMAAAEAIASALAVLAKAGVELE